MSRMKYVQRRANRFEFRFPLPDDLAGQPVVEPWPEALASIVNPRTGRFKTELIRSLQTADRKAAERKALEHITAAHQLVERARTFVLTGPVTGLPTEQEPALVRQREAEILRADEKLRAHGFGLDLKRQVEAVHDGLGMTDDDLEAYSFLINQLDADVRRQIAKSRPSESVGLIVNRAVEEAGLSLHPDDPAWRRLELRFLEANRAGFDGIKARLRGETVPTPEAPGMLEMLSISAALQRWANGGGRGASKPRGRSAAEAARAVEQFVQMHGDLGVASITKAHARAFRDALARVPKSLPRHLAGRTLPELLKLDLSHYPARSAQTVNKTLGLLSAVLARAERDGFMEALPSWTNPFQVSFEIAPSEREPYEPFSVSELKRLFSSPVFAAGERPVGGKGEAAFWFPLIALFSGARRTEIAQLKVGDIRQGEQGIWYFDFTNEGEDQNLKTASSARSVPVHSELIRFGLIDFARDRAEKAGHDQPLWGGFEPPIDPKAKAWTKWFARYLGSHVVEDRAKTFHSFRHTFKRACREAGLSEEIHNALTGHSGGGVGRRYGRERRADGSLDRGISLQRLSAEVQKIAFPDVLTSNILYSPDRPSDTE